MKLLFVLVAAFPFLMTGIQLHPQKLLPRRTPEKLGVTFDTTEFAAQGLTLRGWLLNPGGENPPIVFLHGLNANKDNFLLISAEFARRGFPVLTFDFRAHGESDGRLTTFGLQEKNDVAAAVEWLKRRYPGRHILAVGYSLGGAALLQYSAEQFPFDRIVVDATYATLKDTAMDKLFPYAGPLRDPIFGLLSFWAHVWSGENLGSIDNRIAISKLDPAKVLLIHGTSDRMIDYHQSEQLQAATSNKVELWKIKNADHLGTIADPEYMNRVVKFFLDRGP